MSCAISPANMAACESGGGSHHRNRQRSLLFAALHARAASLLSHAPADSRTTIPAAACASKQVVTRGHSECVLCHIIIHDVRRRTLRHVCSIECGATYVRHLLSVTHSGCSSGSPTRSPASADLPASDISGNCVWWSRLRRGTGTAVLIRTHTCARARARTHTHTRAQAWITLSSHRGSLK